jgi:hypothetical protein
VGTTPANVYGIRDLHGLVWEWVEDFNALMISGDSREQGDPDLLKYCGSGALALEDRENYALAMRLVLLDPQGRVLARSRKLGSPDPAFLKRVRSAIAAGVTRAAGPTTRTGSAG